MSPYRFSLWRAAILPALFAIFAAPTAAQAATIYTFDNFSLAASTVTEHTDASNFDIPPPYSCSTSACGSYANFTAQFTVTPHAGYTLDITGFSFDEWNMTNFGPTRFDVFTSADAFATSILGGPTALNAANYTNHATPLSLFGINSPFTLRIVFSGHPGGVQGLVFLDNLTLDATAVPVTTAVPEPTTMVLLGTGLLGTVISRRRRVR